MSGGTLASSIVVDFLRYFINLKSINEHSVVTESGLFYLDFEREALKQGVIIPSNTLVGEYQDQLLVNIIMV